AARPLWTAGGRPTAQARQAMSILAGSEARGLRPEDYGVARLRRRLDHLASARSPSDIDVARFDVELSLSLMRLASHLHSGRVDPRRLRFDLPETHAAFDPAAVVTAMSRATDVDAVVRGVEPRYAGYRALSGALARYRALAAGADLRPPAPPRTIRPDSVYRDAPALRRWLSALGDMPFGSTSPAPAADTIYRGDLVRGVIAFQRRHGLDADGIIGPATAAQLRVPLERRVRQIELAMERWRWLPDTVPGRTIIVNVPAFRLYAFERDGSLAAPLVSMNVVVGEAESGNGTPLFTGTMREVVFQPYWDVPPSIARSELLPKIRRDAGYMDREQLELVRGGDHDAVVFPPTPENLRLVAQGTLRIRQRPGALNSLGPVKFLFPNRYNVYLHGTPAPELFARSRRDFSHGCIRLEDPAALARWVLDGQAGWDSVSVTTAMTTGRHSRRVRVARPVQVYMLYATAVAEEDGNVRFHPDIYGHDGVLLGALGWRAE
ncbi:MAG TPA: L,D-transpeptidase family protein, partial [Gemmatimonadales bacterium]